MARPETTAVLMDVAHLWAQRSTCSRLHVGAVLARDTRVIATAYNGAPSGIPHCDHSASDNPCTVSVHAEANLVAFAAKYGVATLDSDAYITHAPCRDCAKLLVNAGIAKVYYRDHYRSNEGIALLTSARVDTVQLTR